MTLQAYCKNTASWIEVEKGATLEAAYATLGTLPDLADGPTACLVNNRCEGLHYTLNDSRDIEYVGLTHEAGLLTYTRSLLFVLYKAVNDHYPQARMRVGMPLTGGYYCSLDIEGGITREIADGLRAAMQRIVEADLPFHRVTCHRTDAIRLFRGQGLLQKVKLLESVGDLYTHYYTLGDTADFFYGPLLVSTGRLRTFDLIPYGEGLLLRIPDRRAPHRLAPLMPASKAYEVFREEHRWQDLVGVSTVGELNAALRAGQGAELVAVNEALQEKKIARIADHIADHPQLRIVLIAGPSSSGKTTFAHRLCIHLRACGKRPVQVSIDDYAVDRVLSPRDAHGDYDFEHIEAINLDLFGRQMTALLAGETIELPRYDFTTGVGSPSGRHLRLEADTILIIEGNHALNPRMTASLPDEVKYRVYASALTSTMLDDHNYIPTTDARLLRRICRDNRHRGFPPQEVIRRCPSVTAGEERWILPFQEEADAMVNTSLIYEMAAIRSQALPLLATVPEHAPEYATAQRLRTFLGYFADLPLDDVPPTSLLREFMT